MGSWVTYGLGTENQNLPGFVALCPGGYPILETQNWQSAFLPGIFQGTHVDTRHTDIEKLIENVRNPQFSRKQQRVQLDALRELNRLHLDERGPDAALEARIQSFELAFRMQSAAAEAFDVSREPQHVLDRYGEGTQARQILIARRLVERGVRFVQIYSGGMENERSWDGHTNIKDNHSQFAGETDIPIGALLTDLKQRGLFDETLVIWCGEFGRLPIVQKGGTGRDHNPHAFTTWLAGGGTKGGVHYGSTDEIGHKAVVDRVSINDLHATILHLLGMDHEKLTYRYNGRDFRLTDVAGRVVKEVVA
jgi:hypothetical protein